jgi:serine/threonine-protein kinase
MESIMELDDLKQAWQSLDRRLAQSHELRLHEYRERKLSGLKRLLLPLRFGQAVQMLLGIVVVLIAVAFWRNYWQEPAMLATGILMHAYGVLTIAAGGVIQGRISAVDHAAPVLQIQKQLASLRRAYVVGGMWVGLPWALLWVFGAVMLARAMTGVNLFVSAPWFVYPNLALGVLILLGVRWFHRWSRSPAHPERAKRFEDSVSGRSIRQAQTMIHDVERFERD